MSPFLIVLACLTLFVSLISIAKPELYRNLTKIGANKRNVGPSYWGNYPGCAVEEPQSMKVIAPPPKASKQLNVAGSTSYARGNGPSADAG
jgi:hypothetical protein